MTEIIDGTLKWCNERRKERGKRPLDRMPMGKRYDPESCPCGTATGLWVGTMYYSTGKGYGTQGPLPAMVRRFVNAMDRGELPQYEL